MPSNPAIAEHSTESLNVRSPIAEEVNSPYSITEEDLVRRSATVNRGKYISQLYCCLTVSLGSVCFGIVLGWSSPAIRHHFDNPSADMEFYSVACLPPIGCCVGSIFLSILCYRNGPRKIMLFLTPIQAIVWIVVAANKQPAPTYVMMALSGSISIGFIICGENLLRDSIHVGYYFQFLVIFNSSRKLGILFAYVVGLTFHSIRYYSIFAAFLTLLEMLMLWYLPESPVFLYNQSPTKSEKALSFLRGQNNVHDDMRQIKKNHELRKVDMSARYMLFKPVVFKAIIIIIALCFFKEFTGFMCLVSYGLSNLNNQQGGVGPIDVVGKIADGAILGVSFYVSSLCSRVIHRKFSFTVRKPLIISASAVTIVLIIKTVYYAVLPHVKAIPKGVLYLKIILDVLFVIAYETGWSFYVDEIIYEYLPFQVYPWVKTLSVTLKWFFVYALLEVSRVTQTHLLYVFKSYLSLAVISLAGIVFIKIFVVECKGKTLMDIQIKLGGNPVGSRSAAKRKLDTQRFF